MMLSILLSLFFSSFGGTTVSLVEMGILEAKTGEERFNILYEAHKIANEKNLIVDYTGIDTLKLTIPKNAKSIPLGCQNDFKNAVLIVHNEKKNNFFLFTLTGKADTVTVKDYSMFDTGNFRSEKCLKKGRKMLIIEDKNPWIDKRRGFSYGLNRRDILLLNNGRVLNQTCASYNNTYSNPSCVVVPLTTKQKCFSNVLFSRTPSSTSKTFLVKIELQYNVNVENVKIITPSNDVLYGDECVFLKDCAHVSMNNIIIDGSYSLNDKWGYGISIDNVYNIVFDHIEGNAPWGVFGNNNVNKATLRNSHVNRFDVHCYGRDIYFENCVFDRSGFLYSSLYGEVVFSRCVFNRVFPCHNRLDFNAYSPFDIKFKDCKFFFDNRHYALINLSDIDEIINTRHELTQKCLPNVDVENCLFEIEHNLDFLYLFYVGGCNYSSPIKYLSSIKVNNVIVAGAVIQMNLFNTYVETESKVKVNIDKITHQSINGGKVPCRFVKINTLNRNRDYKKVSIGKCFIK